MQYREALIKLFQDFVNEHVGVVLFTGCTNYGFPKEICYIDYVAESDNSNLQRKYFKFIEDNLGEPAIFGEQEHAVELYPYKYEQYDLRIERQV